MVLSPARSGPPTALWAVPVADLGGVARHVLDVAGVGVPGWRLRFLVPDGPLVPALRERGADVVVARFGPEHGLAASLRSLRGASHDVALVHTHLAYADVVAAVAAPRGVRVVTTEHGLADDDLVYHRSAARSRLRALVHRARLRRADALIAVSDATLRVARAKWLPGEHTLQTVIRNGVDAVPVPPEPAGLHVVSLARLAPEKRLEELLAGFAVLSREQPEARLTLAGVGPLRDRLQHLAHELRVADRTSLPGHVDAGELLAAADVLALLSVWENSSYALLDAVVRGRGVVASRVGGNPELLPDQCLVEDPTDAAAVAARLLEQARTPSQRPALPADWPDVATMAKQIAEVYAEVLP